MQRGMTLLEVLICIGILTIISSTALPVIGESMAKKELEGASLQLVSDIRWLQQLSINECGSTSYILLFNPSEPSSYYVTGNTKVIKRYAFPPSVRLPSTYSPIAFSASGAPLMGAQTIGLHSAKLKSWKYVILAPVSGRVRISNAKPQSLEG